MPEATTYTPESKQAHTTEEALLSARKKSGDQLFDDSENGFLAFLTDKYSNPDHISIEEYWQDFAMFSSKTAGEAATSPIEVDARVIVGFLPNFLIQQDLLNRGTYVQDRQRIRAAKLMTCTYIGLLRDFVTKYPTGYEQLQTNLLSSALELVGTDTDIGDMSFENSINNTLKGIRHEKGFMQLLETLGVKYRPGNTSEDLKGRDVVIIFKGHEIGVDVKSSLDKVDGNNSGHEGSPVAIKANGDIVMFSLLTATDFDEGFTVSSERLQEIAPVAGAFLQAAILQSIAKKS